MPPSLPHQVGLAYTVLALFLIPVAIHRYHLAIQNDDRFLAMVETSHHSSTATDRAASTRTDAKANKASSEIRDANDGAAGSRTQASVDAEQQQQQQQQASILIQVCDPTNHTDTSDHAETSAPKPLGPAPSPSGARSSTAPGSNSHHSAQQRLSHDGAEEEEGVAQPEREREAEAHAKTSPQSAPQQSDTIIQKRAFKTSGNIVAITTLITFFIEVALFVLVLGLE